MVGLPSLREHSSFRHNQQEWIDRQSALANAPKQTSDTASEAEEAELNVFMVERNLKGISMQDLAAAQKAAINTAEAMRGQGTEIRYIRSTFAPEDGRCMCLFEAQTEAEVRQLNDRAGIPYECVVAALDLTPP
jgi:hypothetical protein